MFSIIESSIFIPVISTPFIKQRWHCQITFQHLQAISLITSFVLPSSCCQHPSCKQLVYHPKSRLAVLANNLRHTQIRVSDEIFRNGKVDLENTSEQDISLNCQPDSDMIHQQLSQLEFKHQDLYIRFLFTKIVSKYGPQTYPFRKTRQSFRRQISSHIFFI